MLLNLAPASRETENGVRLAFDFELQKPIFRDGQTLQTLYK
jgi:hypothetical protein